MKKQKDRSSDGDKNLGRKQRRRKHSESEDSSDSLTSSSSDSSDTGIAKCDYSGDSKLTKAIFKKEDAMTTAQIITRYKCTMTVIQCNIRNNDVRCNGI